MTSTLNCSKHPKKKAWYICTNSQCIENKLCGPCVQTHPAHHTNRYLFLDDIFTDKDNYYHLVKKHQKNMIEQLGDIIKSKENSISKFQRKL